MFGTYRTILALMVAVGHLFGPFQLGTYAVFGFYALSGYLMTTIMHCSYGYSADGRLRFGLNRFLRIFPSYWVAAAMTLACIALIGSIPVKTYHPALFTPETATQIAQNLFLLLDYKTEPRLVPPTWALSVELFFYGLICLGLSRTRTRTLLWLGAGLVYTGYILLENMDWKLRYFTIAAASLPFSLGSYLYFLIDNRRIQRLFMTKFLCPILLTGLIFANFIGSFIVQRFTDIPQVFGLGFYLNLALVLLLILSLAMGNVYPFVTRRWDSEIGRLSYPIYLIHWQTGLIVSFFYGGRPYHGISVDGFLNLALSLPIIVLLASLMVNLIDKPIENLRNRIKQPNNPAPSGSDQTQSQI